jgi:glycosyltransferase involved in cell wall biosynthesis
MNSVRLSVIVPVYNVEPYVERCLRSLLENQGLSSTEYEVIVINDGSPDNSRAIVESLQSEFPNLILINQENQGVSMARNNAMAIAKGRYMLPIDPDDYIVPHALRPALEQAEANNLDVLYCAFEIFDRSNHSIWRTDYSGLENQIDNGYDGYFAVRGPKVKDPDRSVAIFYKLDLLRKCEIQYPRDVPMLEDGLFLGLVFSVAQRVGYSDKDFYQRTTRPGSATQSGKWYKEETIKGYKNSLLKLKEYRNSNGRKASSSLLNHLQAKFTVLALDSFLMSLRIKGYFEFFDFLAHNSIKRIDITGLKRPYQDFSRYINLGSMTYLMARNRLLFSSLKNKIMS